MTLPAPAIHALLPHAGRMCLIETVLAWDGTRLACRADNHRDLDHPLRGRGGLAGVHALEYAAQATALHGALAGGGDGASPLRYVAAVRDARIEAPRLDLLDHPLDVEARLLAGDGRAVLYACSVTSGGAPIFAARLTLASPGVA